MEHWCKVCGKSFPCGRSLGGHMRSHLSSSSPVLVADERYARSSKSCINGSGIGYGLRENPKKTWWLSEPAGNAKEYGKICKECGKVFPTFKSLFGHMRRHPQKLHCKLEEETEQGMEKKCASLVNEPGAELVMPTRKRKRSRRLASISGSSSSASEIHKGQEDAALTLMMLSRDNDFRSCVPEAKGIPESWKGISKCRIQHHRNGLKRSESDVPFAESALHDTFMKLEATVCIATKNSSNTACLNLSPGYMFPEAYETKLSSAQVSIVSDGDLHKAPKKNSRYECPLCNKTFNSYQSLGGHRASHIRMKGCTRARTASKKNNAYDEPKMIDIIVDKNVCTGSGSTKKVNRRGTSAQFSVRCSLRAKL